MERDSTEEEFLVPEGFQFVDINENNFKNYVSKIQHLLTEEIGEKLPQGLVGFVKGIEINDEEEEEHSDVEYDNEEEDTTTEIYKLVTREHIDDEYEIPPGFQMIKDKDEIDQEQFDKLINDEEKTEKFNTDLIAIVRFSSIDDNDYDVMEESAINDETEMKEPGECKDTEFQCCPDLVHPQHGYKGYGCCASSRFGCCPDNMTPAPAPFFDVSSESSF